MAADLGLDPGRQRPPADHPLDIRLEQGIANQLAGSAADRAKERPFAVLGDSGSFDVLLKVAVEIVVRGHLVLLAALLVQPHPAAPSLYIEALDPHGDRCSHAREGIDHQANQGTIAQAGKGVIVN